MSISLKADPSGTFGEILVNGATVAKLPVSGNAVIPGLVGTVSQSGGVPTGAIIERGSNANGEYVRFADGTQICFAYREVNLSIDKTYGGAYYNTATWTFPSAFSSFSYGSGTFRIDGRLTYCTGTGSSTNSALVLAVVDPLGSTYSGTYQCRFIAIGRWY